MTKEELLTLATQAAPHSDEDRAAILAGLKAVSAEEAYDVLLKVNQTGGENQRLLMAFLADDTELYEKVAAHVRIKFDARDDESDDHEDHEDESNDEEDEV